MPCKHPSAVLQAMVWLRIIRDKTAEKDSRHGQKSKTLAVVLCKDTGDRLVSHEAEKAELSAETSVWCLTGI